MKILRLDWPADIAARDFGQDLRRGGQDHGVEEDVGDGLFGDHRRIAAHPLGHRVPGQDVGHVAERGDAAGERRLRAAREIVHPARLAGRQIFVDVEVDVRIDPARQDEAAARLDLPGGRHRAADLDDASMPDPHVGLLAPLRRNEDPPANDEVEQRFADQRGKTIGGCRPRFEVCHIPDAPSRRSEPSALSEQIAWGSSSCARASPSREVADPPGFG